MVDPAEWGDSTSGQWTLPIKRAIIHEFYAIQYAVKALAVRELQTGLSSDILFLSLGPVKRLPSGYAQS